MYKKFAIIILVIWSTSAVLIKEMIIVSNNNYWMIIIAYNLIAALLLLSYSVFKGEILHVKPHLRNSEFYVLLLCNGFYDVLMALAITFSLCIQYAIIGNYLWPIFLSLLIPFVRKTKPEKNPIIGSIFGFASVLLIFYPSINSGVQANITGILLAVAAAFLWAYYSVKINASHLNVAVFIQGIAQLISGAVAIILAVYFNKLNINDITNVNSLILISFYSIFNMSLAYVLWIMLMVKHPEIQKFTVKIYLLPVLSLIISAAWFREELNLYILPASVLLLMGIAYSENHIEKIKSALIKSQ